MSQNDSHVNIMTPVNYVETTSELSPILAISAWWYLRIWTPI